MDREHDTAADQANESGVAARPAAGGLEAIQRAVGNAGMARLLGSNVGISPEELRSLPEQEKLAHVVRLGHAAGLVPADFGLAQIEPLFATFAANLQASRAYAPEPYTGRLTLWVSEATAASYAAALDAWSRLVPAGLDRTILPGDHYSLLRRPEVKRLARELTAQLVRNKM